MGTSSYLRFAAMLNEYGATDNSVASLLNKLTGKITGDPYNASMSTLESLMVNNLGFGINNYYGLFISPDLPGRGEKHPIALVKGQEKQQLDRMVQEAMEIGRKTYEDAFMEISIPPMSYQGEYGGINFTIDTGNTSSFRLSVGYGYDFITRNSNSFIGTVIRNSNLGLPTNVNRAMGIGNNFTDWTSWDTAIQEMFQEATLNALRDLGAEFK